MKKSTSVSTPDEDPREKETIVPCGTDVSIDDEVKWTCRDCVGRTGRPLTFSIGKGGEPSHCPWCGYTDTISTVRGYVGGTDYQTPFEEDKWL